MKTLITAIAVGASGTAGSRDYSAIRFSGDAWGTGDDLTPYLGAEFMSDDIQRTVSLGGGVWKTLEEKLWGKLGLSLVSGHYRNSDRSAGSTVLEAGLEGDLGGPVLGGEYRYGSGSIGTTSAGPAGGGPVQRPPRRFTRLATFSSSEVTGYLRIPAGAETVGARATVYDPSDGETVVSETLSLSHPFSEELSGTAALTFEQARSRDGVYVTLGFRYGFKPRGE